MNQEPEILFKSQEIQALADAIITKLVKERQAKGFHISDEDHYLQHRDLIRIRKDFEELKPYFDDFKEFMQTWKHTKNSFWRLFWSAVILGSLFLASIGFNFKFKELM